MANTSGEKELKRIWPNVTGLEGGDGSIIPGCAGHYKFNDNSEDSSGNSNDGSDTNITYVTGKIDKAADFNGADGHIIVPDDTTIQNIYDGGGSVSFWVNPDSLTNDEAMIEKRGAAGTSGWYIVFKDVSGNDAAIQFRQEHSGTAGLWQTTERVITIGTWTHITILYDSDSASNKPTIYVDGSSVAVTETVTPTGTRTSDVGNDLWIGALAQGVGLNPMDGQIDDLRIHDETLSQIDITDIYNSGSGTESENRPEPSKLEGRQSNLVPEKGSLFPRRLRAGIDD